MTLYNFLKQKLYEIFEKNKFLYKTKSEITPKFQSILTNNIIMICR